MSRQGMSTSEAMTEGVRVRVRSVFIPERSRVDAAQYFFAYQVTIRNESDAPVKLLSRHWIILDDEQKREEVRGPGVVGEQPLLAPGESFEYTSACVLNTERGHMHGTYRMLRSGGRTFDAVVAPFELAVHRLH